MHPGDTIVAQYSFLHDKSGGVVALCPGGSPSLFVVEVDCGTPGAGGKNKWGQCSPSGPTYFLNQLKAIASQPMFGAQGSVVFTAPGPGSYQMQTIYDRDGGTIDRVEFAVTPPPPTQASTPTPGGGYPEGTFVKQNYGPAIGQIQGGRLHLFNTWQDYLNAGGPVGADGRADLSRLVSVDANTWNAMMSPVAAPPSAPPPPPPAPAPQPDATAAAAAAAAAAQAAAQAASAAAAAAAPTAPAAAQAALAAAQAAQAAAA